MISPSPRIPSPAALSLAAMRLVIVRVIVPALVQLDGALFMSANMERAMFKFQKSSGQKGKPAMPAIEVARTILCSVPRETVNINGREFAVVDSGRATRPLQGLPRPSPAKAGKAHRIIATALDGLPVAQGTLSLSAVPPSVNAIFFNRPKGKGRGKTLAYRNWRAFADRELRDQPPWHVPGKVEVRIYLAATTRGDADNRIKATLDALVCAGRIEDDRNVVKVGAEFANLDEGQGAVFLIQARPA